MKNLHVAVTSIVIILALVGISRADYLDVFFAFQAQDPSNPTVENGQVLWGSDWHEFNLSNNSFYLGPGSVYLGLSNQYEDDLFKTVTLQYTSNMEFDISGTLAGNNPPETVSWNSVSQSVGPAAGNVYTITGIIGPPQPWWEWIKLTNSTEQFQGIFTVNQYTSVCPEPSTFVLLVVGAISLITYGWRRRK
jgi:hypothetical protein